MPLDSKIPGGPLAEKWDRHRFESKLINPANRRKFTIIVVGTGLAGASAAASLRARLQRPELLHPRQSKARTASPRRAASTPRRTTRTTGDSIQRLFYDTIKGGTTGRAKRTSTAWRRRASEHHRPVRRAGRAVRPEYGGLLDNRSFGGAQVSSTFYARGKTGQQLLLGAYQSMMRQVEKGTVESLPNWKCSTSWSSTAGAAASSAATC